MGDDEQQPKRPIPSELELEQVDSDFAFALALQEQERNLAMLENESDGDRSISYDDEDEDEDENEEEEDSQEMDAELDFSEGEDDSNGDFDELMEEDAIDPDELSYEELMALGETVGDENRGLSLEQISSCLEPISADTKIIVYRCVICQVEYEEEGGGREMLVALPSCEHTFHSDCISSWLQIKKTCPICGTEVVNTI